MNTINYKNTSIVFIIIIFIIYYLTFIIASIIEYKCNKLIKNKTIEKFNNKYTSKINKNKMTIFLYTLKKPFFNPFSNGILQGLLYFLNFTERYEVLAKLKTLLKRFKNNLLYIIWK